MPGKHRQPNRRRRPLNCCTRTTMWYDDSSDRDEQLREFLRSPRLEGNKSCTACLHVRRLMSTELSKVHCIAPMSLASTGEPSSLHTRQPSFRQRRWWRRLRLRRWWWGGGGRGGGGGGDGRGGRILSYVQQPPLKKQRITLPLHD